MSIAGPIMGFILAMVLGGIVAIIGRKIVGMKIPVLIRGSIELAGASGLSVLAFSAAIAGSYSMTAILQYVIATGFIGLLFILNTMVIQHPFNACLGPNEDQRRTLKLASTTAFFAMAIVGILGVGTHPAWWVISSYWCYRMVYIIQSILTRFSGNMQHQLDGLDSGQKRTNSKEEAKW